MIDNSPEKIEPIDKWGTLTPREMGTWAVVEFYRKTEKAGISLCSRAERERAERWGVWGLLREKPRTLP